jgi:hypothetical protein
LRRRAEVAKHESFRYAGNMTLRAHFDGKVIVPDEPVDLPTDSSLEIEVRTSPRKAKARGFKIKNGIPLARNDGVTMTAEEVAAALYD